MPAVYGRLWAFSPCSPVLSACAAFVSSPSNARGRYRSDCPGPAYFRLPFTAGCDIIISSPSPCGEGFGGGDFLAFFPLNSGVTRCVYTPFPAIHIFLSISLKNKQAAGVCVSPQTHKNLMDSMSIKFFKISINPVRYIYYTNYQIS